MFDRKYVRPVLRSNISTVMIDRTNVRSFQDFSGSSTFFTVEIFYDFGILEGRCKIVAFFGSQYFER